MLVSQQPSHSHHLGNTIHLGQVTKPWLSCYPALPSNDSKTRQQDSLSFVTYVQLGNLNNQDSTEHNRLLHFILVMSYGSGHGAATVQPLTLANSWQQNQEMSQSHGTLVHTIKLRSSSPWVSALVLSIDFWRIKQWPTTTKAASSPVGNVACGCKPKQCSGICDLFHWRFCIYKSQLTKISCDTTQCSIHKSTKVVAFHLLRQQMFLDTSKILLFHFDKISDKWWLRRIWLPHVVTWAHVWMKTVRSNQIVTLRR